MWVRVFLLEALYSVHALRSARSVWVSGLVRRDARRRGSAACTSAQRKPHTVQSTGARRGKRSRFGFSRHQRGRRLLLAIGVPLHSEHPRVQAASAGARTWHSSSRLLRAPLQLARPTLPDFKCARDDEDA